MKILKRDSLPEGGFAGLKEHRLVKEPTLFGPQENSDGSWPGLAKLVYLADARFMPHGETRMHNHHEIDVISVMVSGNIKHEGSMGNGKDLLPDNVQVQRAGGEGFSHNEINPDDEWNRMIQLWILPEMAGQAARYKVYEPERGKFTRIYGGDDTPETEFSAKTILEVGLLDDGQKIEVDAPFLAYLTRGKGLANNESVEEGDLFRGDCLVFKAMEEVQLIVIHVDQA